MEISVVDFWTEGVGQVDEVFETGDYRRRTSSDYYCISSGRNKNRCSQRPVPARQHSDPTARDTGDAMKTNTYRVECGNVSR